ncbi:hypothetical protein K1719_005418 [Acacia pycnantha]|nr:hypothetical protein K1719_005418 [Acacia pycnantha]
MIRLLNSIPPCLLFCLVILLFPRIIKGHHYCSGPTYAPNSTYHKNLIRLLSSLSSNAIQSNGFYNTTVGQNSDNTIYGLFLCRGDATIEACDKCVSTAIKDITTPQKCPNTTQAVGWYGETQDVGWYGVCMIRYSDTYIFSVENDNPLGFSHHNANATDQSGFMELALDTLNAVAKQAAYGGGGKKFATKEVGGEVLAASCTARYAVYPFYKVTLLPPSPPPLLPPPPPPQLTETPSNGKSKISVVTIIAIAVHSAILILQVSLCFLCRKWRARMNASLPKNVEISSVESLHFDLDAIKSATNDFSPDNKLGQGGYGEVYVQGYFT